MNKKLLISLLLILITLTSCGGGSGGDSSSDNEYSGTWRGNLARAFNNCDASPATTLSSQVYKMAHITEEPLSDRGGRPVMNDGTEEYLGSAFVDDSREDQPVFIADSTRRAENGLVMFFTGQPHNLPNFVQGKTCTEVVSYSFQNFDLDGNKALVLRDSNIDCKEPGEEFPSSFCQVTYFGEITRDAATLRNIP